MTEKTGKIADCKVVDEGDDILLVSDDGTIIRIAAASISVYGRYAQGVRLMRPTEGSRVISVARTEHEESAEMENPAAAEQSPETVADSDGEDTPR